IVYYHKENGSDQSHFIPKDKLPYDNSKNPDKVKILYTYKWDKLKSSLFLNYTHEYTKLMATNETKTYNYYNKDARKTIYSSVPVYDYVKHESTKTVDLSFIYDTSIFKKKLSFKIDINNALNEKAKLSHSIKTYQAGRQFWIEANYLF
ncbi:MAG: hypothetical protein OIF32_05090, partial [Campylobacterales bacterium]|nr:hypothetical protein [Campylobacterales bacterium]